MESIKKDKKALFLDRDGVLNYLISNRPPWDISEIEFYSDAFEIVNLSIKRSFIPIIITNQPDAGRGSISYKNLKDINSYIVKRLGIKYSYICTHPYDGMCSCRKPLPGMIIEAVREHNILIEESFLIGDRDKDIIAGNSAGCSTIKLSKIPSPIANYNVNKDNN